jgi:hypothetical protein
MRYFTVKTKRGEWEVYDSHFMPVRLKAIFSTKRKADAYLKFLMTGAVEHTIHSN